MPRYDSRQLVDNIERLIAGTPLSSIPSPFLHAPDPVPEEGEPESTDSDAQTSTVRALSLSIFPSLRQHQRVDHVPGGTRLAFLKKIVMRLMRVVSGPQAAFNYFVYSAFEVIAQHLDTVRRRVNQYEGAHRRDKADTAVKVAGIHQAVEVLETRLSEEVLSLRAAVNTTLERMAGDFETRLAQVDARGRLDDFDNRIAQIKLFTEEHARHSRDLSEKAFQSSRDMVESIWKGLEERDVQLLNTTKGVQTCHLQISKLENDTREAQARLLVLNEQINIQLDLLEKMRTQLERKHAEQLAATEGIAGVAPIASASSTGAPAAPAVSPAAPSPAAPQVRTFESPYIPALESSRSRPGEGIPPSLAPSLSEPSSPSLEAHQVDLAYLRFQRQYRGDEAMLKERQQQYVDLIVRHLEGEKPAAAPGRRRLLDLACGDGFFLDLWRGREGWDVHGVDISAAMIRLGRGAGLSLEQADAFAYLESGPEKSWDAITSFQFIEHLDKAELVRLMRGCKRALKPGGLLLFETLNPHSMISHKWFHLDLTHKRLIFPEMAGLLLESLGMRVLETTAVSEVHESEKLQLLGDARLQANFDRLNEFLYAKQDYYILAQRP